MKVVAISLQVYDNFDMENSNIISVLFFKAFFVSPHSDSMSWYDMIMLLLYINRVDLYIYEYDNLL